MRKRPEFRVIHVEYGVQVRPGDTAPAEVYDDLREAKAACKRLGGTIVQRTVYESDWGSTGQPAQPADDHWSG